MKITTVVIDCDGCLTDGRQYIMEDGGKLCKTFHSRDRMALRRILEAGYRVIIASADDWPGVKAWAETITAPDGRHVEFVHIRKKHELDLQWGEVLGVGDDIEDKDFLFKSELGLVPGDGDATLRNHLNLLTMETGGGSGIVPEIEDELKMIKIYGKPRMRKYAIYS
jgi:3-deoxy-D-manno-octulosonate 8-phosphate phosphatase KdsC-like HAD superfamily phosphatase